MRIVVVGNSVANSYQKKLRNREMDIIPNAVKLSPPLTLQEKKALRVALAKDAERPLLITVGRLMVDKGFHDLLLAFAKVRKIYPKAFLVIVGDGELKQELQAYATSLGLDDHIRFTGLRDDVSKVLLAGDIYVNSSHREGMSVAMLEAMAAGLPILATNVGDAEYLLKDSRGIIVSPGDPGALATGICDLFKSSDLRSSLGNAARELIEKKYTLDVWMNSLLDVYDKVMPQEIIT
jgi:glycosyltransferase involved in cell wall biosynthesis